MLATLQGRWFQFSQSSNVHLLSTGVLVLCRVLGLCSPCRPPLGGGGLWIEYNFWLLSLRGWDCREWMNLNNKGEKEVISEQIFIKTALLGKLLLCCSSHRLLPNPVFSYFPSERVSVNGFSGLWEVKDWMLNCGLWVEPHCWRKLGYIGSVGKGAGSVAALCSP